MTIGVYAVVNQELGQISYIGCSLNIEKRWKHVLRKLKNNIYEGKLQDSFNRLGEKAISWEILEETSPENRWDRENYWIDLYNPEAGRKGRPDQWKAANLIWENPESRAEAIDALKKSVTGRTLSEEARRKISQAHTGKPSPMKGIPKSLESRKRMSIAHSGVKASPETKQRQREAQTARWQKIKNQENVPASEIQRREKIRQALQGKPRPIEVIKKFSASLKGREVWNKGIPHSEETKKKISEALRKRKSTSE